MKDAAIKNMKERMDKTIEVLHHEMAKIRTGRASLSILDGVKVEYYGISTPLTQVAALSVPESRMITIQPWDVSLIGTIEKAILASNLGLNPTNDGKIIRISIPHLTEERRKEFVKAAKKTAEDSKVSIRNIRRDANEEFKKLEKDKTMSQDEHKRLQAQVQEITDKYIAKVDEVFHHKEKEILEV
ncbi:MAG: ribosome recycling factor [Deltaproteobacteria bacterium GWC2_42_11]|nr:MAG: ribosome recycling factor [Deltaproteobacteria bacterium GWC2_42_11]HBO84613.1 ribosome recycling factor [Deltaproteobacteria bacterium]